MDELAFLCTLHGEGPATRAQLATAGIGDLAGLLALSPAHIARALGVSTASAARLQREARELARRPAPLEPPEAADGEDEVGARAALETEREPRIGTSASALASGRADASWSTCAAHVRAGALDAEETRSLPHGAGASGESAGDPPPAERSPTPPPRASARAVPLVVAREPVASPPTGARESASSRAAALQHSNPSSAARDASARAARTARAPSAGGAARPADGSREGTPLSADLVGDLDRELVAALAEAGVRTLEELAAASGLALARRTGFAFTRLFELGLQAQRLLEALAPSARENAAEPLARATAPERRRRLTDRLSASAPAPEPDRP